MPLERDGLLEYRDPRLPKKPPTRRWELFLPRVAQPGDERYGRWRDPKRNHPYLYRLQVRCLVEGEGETRSDRRFVIHYQRTQDEALARRTGAVLARLYWLVRDYLGRVPPASDEGKGHVEVWLQPDGMPGGEEYEGHLYLTAIDAPRAPAEWVRELAHEYAHLTLPEAGPYREPEKWANGYLGERLLLKWLLVDNGVTDCWDQPINAAGYLTHQVMPFRTRFLDAGPASPDADRMDAVGMEYFIGAVLALEAAHGPTLIRALFDRFKTPRPQNLGGYLTLALRDMQPEPLSLNPAAYIPGSVRPKGAGFGPDGLPAERAAYWIYLTGGRWLVEVEGETPPGATARAEDRRLRAASDEALEGSRAWALPITTNNGMWRRLEFQAPPGETLALRAVRLRRVGE